jgi:transposase
MGMQVESGEPEIIERVAALDVGKAEVVCCAPVSGPGGQRMQEVRATSMMTAALLGLADWLAALGVTRVAMEATCARPAEQVGAAGRLAVADG